MALMIARDTYCPDSTYFRTSEAEPRLSDDGRTLLLVNGEGKRRSSWGAPGVTSTAVLHDDDLVAVHVGFHHKHGGGQFWRHYRVVDGQWHQVAWAQLSDAERTRILAAAEQKAPGWAKAPGKLRSTYQAPRLKVRRSYKIVRVLDDGRMVSLFDGATEYVLGKRLAERAIGGHRGGYYSYQSPIYLRALFDRGELVPLECYKPGMTAALLEVEISGTILRYEATVGHKLASTYLRPVRVVETFGYQQPSPSAEEAIAC